MGIKLSLPEDLILKPLITVFGVGGAGGNALNNMLESKLEGVRFVAANTDAQALEHSMAENKIQLGRKLTQGLGAGSNPSVGAAAAEESLPDIIRYIADSHMVFVTAGMGGGTGTGAAPVIARAAKEKGILTIGVITKPFSFEGKRRMSLADEGIADLKKYVDTLISIPNQNLFKISTEKTKFSEAFKLADQVLYSGIQGITDLMLRPGLINLDFADIRTVMNEMGNAVMGTGEAEGENRAIKAAEGAIYNPLFAYASMKGAKGMLINVTGGEDITLFEVDEAANRVRKEVENEDTNVIFGSTFCEKLKGKIRVSIVATGIDSKPTSARITLPGKVGEESQSQISHKHMEQTKTMPNRDNVEQHVARIEGWMKKLMNKIVTPAQNSVDKVAEQKTKNSKPQAKIFLEEEIHAIPSFMRRKNKERIDE